MFSQVEIGNIVAECQDYSQAGVDKVLYPMAENDCAQIAEVVDQQRPETYAMQKSMNNCICAEYNIELTKNKLK